MTKTMFKVLLAHGDCCKECEAVVEVAVNLFKDKDRQLEEARERLKRVLENKA